MATNDVESRISRAVSDAVADHMVNGTSPDEAIAKIAMAQDLSIPMTERAVEIFNAAKTRVFLKSAEDKTASFPVADTRKTIMLAFGSGLPQKVAEAKESSFESSFSYPTQKAAAAEEEDAVDQGELKLQLHKAMNTLKCASETARMGYTESFDLCRDAFSAAGRAAINSPEWEDTVAEFRYVKGDPACEWIISKVAELAEREIPAPIQSGYTQSEIDPVIYNAMDEAYGHMKTATFSLAAQAQAVEMFGAVEEIFKQKTAATPPPPPGPAGGKPKAPAPAKPSGGYNENAFYKFLRDDVGTLGGMNPHPGRQEPINSAINGVYADSAKWKFEKSRGVGPGSVAKLSPEEEGENLVRQRIFLKLLHGDEILAESDPQDVARHFNTLVRIAPEVSLVPEAARSFLRNMVHSGGGIDMFSVEQAGKATGAMQKARRPGELEANPALKEIREKQMAGAR